MRALGFLLSVSLTACGGNFTQYERDGDNALAGGDRTKAAELYSKALEKRPIMDFDYERVRDKRLAAVGAEWKPKINSAIEGGGGDAVTKLETLLETRRGAREAGAAAADLRQIEDRKSVV